MKIGCCYKCERRKVGCHGTCEDYQAAVKENKERKDMIKRNKWHESEMDAFDFKRIRRGGKRYAK